MKGILISYSSLFHFLNSYLPIFLTSNLISPSLSFNFTQAAYGNKVCSWCEYQAVGLGLAATKQYSIPDNTEIKQIYRHAKEKPRLITQMICKHQRIEDCSN